jgi:hypothetical protein
MRPLSTGIRGGTAVLTFVVVLAARIAFADDPSPFQPPEARISPPGGVSSQARISPPGGAPSPDARSVPASGGPSRPVARVQPPISSSQAEPSILDLFLDWLVIHARIRPPIG